MKMVDKSSKLDKFSANMGVSGTGAGGSGGGGSGVNSGYTTGASGVLQTGVGSQNGQKPVPMKLFAAWEVDRTPPNCMPRLCSLTITRLSILTPLPGDMTSLTLAVKMQSSKRTLRSHEIPINSSGFTQSGASGGTVTGSTAPNSAAGGGGGVGGNMLQQSNSAAALIGGGGGSGSAQMGSAIIGTPGNIGNTGIGIGGSGSGASMTMGGYGGVGGGATTMPLAETELDLHFSLQYPHFIKRDGNSNRIGYNLPFSPFSRSNAHRLVILLQRRKKYKSRTILGYKTLAEGIIRMDAVLQKSMDMTVELTATGKNGRPGTTVACLRAERVSSIPVDQDNKNNNSVLLADRVAEYSDEDEEGEFSSGEFNDEATELGLPGYDPKRDYNPSKHDMRKYRKLQRSEVEDVALGTNPVDSDSEFEMKDKSSSRAKISRTISLQQRNFKQKIVALLKRFKASEELEGEVSRGTAALRGERDLDALFQELESLSCCEGDDSGPDMDSLSIGSTPKPSLRPFFTNSRIMLHDNSAGGDRPTDYRNDSSGNEGNAFNTDGQNSDPQNSPPRSDKDYMRLQLLQQQQQQQEQLLRHLQIQKQNSISKRLSNSATTVQMQNDAADSSRSMQGRQGGQRPTLERSSAVRGTTPQRGLVPQRGATPQFSHDSDQLDEYTGATSLGAGGGQLISARDRSPSIFLEPPSPDPTQIIYGPGWGRPMSPMDLPPEPRPKSPTPSKSSRLRPKLHLPLGRLGRSSSTDQRESNRLKEDLQLLVDNPVFNCENLRQRNFDAFFESGEPKYKLQPMTPNSAPAGSLSSASSQYSPQIDGRSTKSAGGGGGGGGLFAPTPNEGKAALNSRSRSTEQPVSPGRERRAASVSSGVVPQKGDRFFNKIFKWSKKS
uniref:Phosphofurin acidic cluster sorting protein 1 n=1 Tax=Zeugodacus cucurbitae TaxID=28588 RepID=A0A0A1X8G1_ZEUCU